MEKIEQVPPAFYGLEGQQWELSPIGIWRRGRHEVFEQWSVPEQRVVGWVAYDHTPRYAEFGGHRSLMSSRMLGVHPTKEAAMAVCDSDIERQTSVTP
jgi:hypothetical protein